MSSNPVESVESTSNDTPNEAAPPAADYKSISKAAHAHVSSLHGLLGDWVRLRNKGTRICRAISTLRLNECTDGYVPPQLKPLTDNLAEILEGLKSVVDGCELISTQMAALAKLQPATYPTIFTWPAKKIATNVHRIFTSLQKEYAMKEIVAESIAHCKDVNLTEVYVCAWEFEVNFNIVRNAFLFAEVGLPGLT